MAVCDDAVLAVSDTCGAVSLGRSPVRLLLSRRGGGSCNYLRSCPATGPWHLVLDPSSCMPIIHSDDPMLADIPLDYCGDPAFSISFPRRPRINER